MPVFPDSHPPVQSKTASMLTNSVPLNSTQTTIYLTPYNSSLFPTSVWYLSKSPSSSVHFKNTTIPLNLSLSSTGYVLFVPGETETSPSPAVPVPTNSSADGWITNFSVNSVVPAGNWSLSAGISMTKGVKVNGAIWLGASIYSWNSSTHNFTSMLSLSNGTFNLANQPTGNHVVNLSGKGSRYSLSGSQQIFVEYYLNLSSFSSTTSYYFTLSAGGASNYSSYVRYPSFGWLNGSVSPSNSNVTVNGKAVSSASHGAFNVTLGQGTYWVNASLSGYRNYSKQITIVSGFPDYLNFSLQKEYTVNITENGIASGTHWSVNLSGMQKTSSTNYTEFMVINGTYNLSIPYVPGYRIDFYNTSIAVNGSAVHRVINFTTAYYVATFYETGLPLPTLWGISINSVNYSSDKSSLSVNLSNGTYAFTAITVPHFSMSPSSGSFTVSGNSVSRTVSFTAINYTVYFRESGLHSGIEWTVTLDNYVQSSNRTVIAFSVPEGTYNYSISIASGYRVLNSTGRVTVASGNVTIDATFLTVKTTSNGIFPGPLNLIYFLILVVVLVQVEVVASFLYFRRYRSKDRRNSSTQGKSDNGNGDSFTRPVSEILFESGASAAVTRTAPAPGTGGPATKGGPAAATLSSTTRTPNSNVVLEYGCTYAVFEEKAEKSLSLFGTALKNGLKGLCFTREFPDKLAQKHDLSGATVIWLSNMGSQNSIRPKDLEKITLQCNEVLNSSQCIIMIDGLEYLITNNGFISVLKLLQFLRDATAVNRSLLILSINPQAIKDSEASLIRREVDRTIE